MKQSQMDRIIDTLFPAGDDGSDSMQVYAVLDGAQTPRIYEALYESRLPYERLFTRTRSSDAYPITDLTETSPYLVHLTREAPLLRWILEDGWHQNYGIFAWSEAELERLRLHFRYLLQVKDEAGNRLYFRYYDPRVLRVYLPTCTAPELWKVLGPTRRLFVPSEDGELLAFRYEEGRPLRTDEISLS